MAAGDLAPRPPQCGCGGCTAGRAWQDSAEGGLGKKSSVLTVFIEMNTNVQTSDSEFSFRFSKGKSFCAIVAAIICETTSVINCLTELLQVHQPIH